MGTRSFELKDEQPLLRLPAILILGIIKIFHIFLLTVSIMNTYGPDKNVHLFCALGSLSHECFCCKVLPEHIKFKA